LGRAHQTSTKNVIQDSGVSLSDRKDISKLRACSQTTRSDSSQERIKVAPNGYIEYVCGEGGHERMRHETEVSEEFPGLVQSRKKHILVRHAESRSNGRFHYIVSVEYM
jgi:hypothetical protein